MENEESLDLDIEELIVKADLLEEINMEIEDSNSMRDTKKEVKICAIFVDSFFSSFFFFFFFIVFFGEFLLVWLNTICYYSKAYIFLIILKGLN